MLPRRTKQPCKRSRHRRVLRGDGVRIGRGCGDRDIYCIVGKIVNVAAEECVLSENGKVNPAKLNALILGQFQNGYYVTGKQVGRAWNAGAALAKAK